MRESGTACRYYGDLPPGPPAMRTIAAFLLAVFLGLAAHAARAVDVPAVRSTDGSSANWRNTIGANQSATAGWAFRVGPTAVQVRALGLYDATDGLRDSHPIGLWSAGGSLLAQATLPAGTASQRIGSYRYVAIAPVTLNPGQTYVIGAYFGPVADQCGSACGDVMLYAGDETYDMRISFVQSRQTLSVAGAGTLAYPGVFAGVDEGFFGPNFLLAADLTPDPFAFAAQANAAPGAVATSDPVTVSGIDNPTAISVSGGTYSINAGAYTAAAGTVLPGDTVTVRLTAAPTFATTTTATLTIGGVSADFVVTTAAADTVPNPFAFVPQTGAAPGSMATSKAIAVTGINSPSTIAVAGGRYSVNGAAYTITTATVSPDDAVTVQLTAAPTFATVATATLTIGGVSADFVVTTAAADTVPDPFAFAPQSGVAPNTLVTSDAVTVSGIDSPSPISIAGGAYSINGAAYTSAPGSVRNGDMVSIQLTSAASFATHTQATVTIGGVSSTFDVITRGAPPAQPVPLLGRGAIALLAALLALVGLGAVRRPRRQ